MKGSYRDTELVEAARFGCDRDGPNCCVRMVKSDLSAGGKESDTRSSLEASGAGRGSTWASV